MSAKLVTIGDSLSQGMTNASNDLTQLSYPAAIARCLGATPTKASSVPTGQLPFRIPDFSGEGGLPVNLEKMVRLLAERYGPEINWMEVVPAALSVRSQVDRIEDYWERGAGSKASFTGPVHHNLAVSGFKLGDCDTLTEAACRRALPEPKDDFVGQVPEMPMYRSARRTLNPRYDRRFENLSQLDLAKAIAHVEGGIENLIFWLGANNALSTVTQLRIQWSRASDLLLSSHLQTANLWRPEHFRALIERIGPKIEAIAAQRVFIGTIPHVTIPPISRGVSPGLDETRDRSSDGYYEYYTHFWIWDDEFEKAPERFPYLSREDARLVDRTINDYNAILKEEAQKRGWFVVDVCQLLDNLAFRRQGGETSYSFPPAMLEAFRRNPNTKDWVTLEGDRSPDTRFLRIVTEGSQTRYMGGLFSLDGFHPTTLGYGLVAEEFLNVMKRAGTAIERPLDWDAIVAADTLLTDPPVNLESLRRTLGFLYHRTPLRDIISTF
ncbi:MAG: hypothetical protein SW833_10940 [Cyanobacteriota bacterium]|nr:hypothetical protein [Cyanobacteriota bacterium]